MKIGRFVSLRAFVKKVKEFIEMKKLYLRFRRIVVFLPYRKRLMEKGL